MIYNIELKEEVKADLLEFDKSMQILIVKQFHKIAKSPELGQQLGNKNGYNLSGCRKMYACGKKVCIVYKTIEEQIIIEVIALGKRGEMEVYKKASQRV